MENTIVRMGNHATLENGDNGYRHVSTLQGKGCRHLLLPKWRCEEAHARVTKELPSFH